MKTSIKAFVLSFFLLIIGNISFAQLNVDDLNKTVMKVSVLFRKPGNSTLKSSAGTGFFWENTNQLITSLHLLRNNHLKIIIKDTKGNKTTAKVSRIFKDMDLMLLQVDNPHSSWQALTRKNPQVQSQETLRAIGYIGNSQAWFQKTVAAAFSSSGPFLPLQFFLPSQAEIKAIKAQGYPSVDKNVLSLEGSLLHGYSGSPIFNTSGALVAVGDGGLENGASGVSWGIPVNHIDYLLTSNEQVSNIDFSGSDLLYSTEESVAPEELLDDKSNTVEPPVVALRSFKLENGYEFVYVKTRTLNQMIETSDDPERIQSLVSQYRAFDFNLENVAFDVFEEIRTGMIFVVPTNLGLSIDVAGSGSRIDARNDNYFVSMIPEGYVGESLEDFVKYYEEDGDEEVLESIELQTTNQGIIRYIKSKTYDLEENKPLLYSYRKLLKMHEKEISALGFLSINDDWQQYDLLNIIQNQTTSGLPAHIRDRIRLKAIMDINMSLHGIGNAKVKRSESLSLYDWNKLGLTFGIPESTPDDEITSTGEMFEASGNIIFRVRHSESQTDLGAEDLKERLKSYSGYVDWEPYTENEFSDVYDMGGLLGSMAFFHTSESKTVTAIRMYIIDLDSPKTLINITIIFENEDFDTVYDMIGAIQKIDN